MRPLLATLYVLAVIGLVGPAHADPDGTAGADSGDSTFLASLHAVGITYRAADQAVDTAKLVCRLAEGGKSGPDVVSMLVSRNPGLAQDRAAQFMAIAERSYCPNQLAPSPGGGQ